MNTVELFSGTGSFSKAFKAAGHDTFTVDIESKFNPDLICNLLKPMPTLLQQKIMDADIIWMSPPCTTFSIASGNTHWTADHKPKTAAAKIGRECLNFCKMIADYCDAQGKTYFIENPVGRMRWFMDGYHKVTVWYCQYGDERAKPTDVWTNLTEWNGKSCKNNNPECGHTRAPRGSKTGTQGLKNAKDRGVIPQELFKELLSVINDVQVKQ